MTEHIWPVNLSTAQLRRLLNDGWSLNDVWPCRDGSVQWDLCRPV